MAVHHKQLRMLEPGVLAGLHRVRDFGGYILFGNAAARRVHPVAPIVLELRRRGI